MDELMAMRFADYRAKKEVYALMVQIMVRSIANNHSPEMAAALMFRDQHGYGTGSGWLVILGPAGHHRRPEGVRRHLGRGRPGQAVRGHGSNN